MFYKNIGDLSAVTHLEWRTGDFHIVIELMGRYSYTKSVVTPEKHVSTAITFSLNTKCFF